MSSIVKLPDAEREVALVDAPSISVNDRTETNLKSARLEYELSLHNLRSEFLVREDRIRQSYLDNVRAIIEA